MVYLRENPTKMDDDWGYPVMTQETHILDSINSTGTRRQSRGRRVMARDSLRAPHWGPELWQRQLAARRDLLAPGAVIAAFFEGWIWEHKKGATLWRKELCDVCVCVYILYICNYVYVSYNRFDCVIILSIQKDMYSIIYSFIYIYIYM